MPRNPGVYQGCFTSRPPQQVLHFSTGVYTIVTHPRIYSPPTPIGHAVEQVDAWMESPSLVLLAEGAGYWPHLRTQVLDGRLSGPIVHDARVAALCIQHGVRELWTTDRDFSRFAGLRVSNPLR